MSHISYSALKVWNDCPFKYKLQYEDKIGKFTGSEYTAFGTALHEAAELKVLDNNVDETQTFLNKFNSEIQILREQLTKVDEKLLKDMTEQGKLLAPQIIPALQSHFGNFKVLAAEEDIYEAISEQFSFKGFIDLIIQDEGGTVHIVDWKSCAWGWDAKKKSDAMTTYQLTFYKHFYSKKYNIDPKNIETHFALLKRTAKKNNVEIFRVTSGAKKTENAFKILNNALYNISKKNFPKNKLNCKYCEYKNTEYCP